VTPDGGKKKWCVETTTLREQFTNYNSVKKYTPSVSHPSLYRQAPYPGMGKYNTII